MRCLITGITGFAGSHLAEYLLERGDVEVFGIERWRSQKDNIHHIQESLVLIECDIRDATSVRKCIERVKPHWIFHLAAQSFVVTSWHAPAETLSTNIIGNLNILEAVREVGIDPLIQVAGSSEEYGLVYPNEIPVKETNPLRPLSPYAVSKVAQDLLSYQYHKSYGMRIIRTRAFNHTGPRRGGVFVCSDFTRQVVEVEKKKRPPVIHVGNLDARRDFTDVRDIVRGYVLALEKGRPGEVYNICSGKAYSIREVLEMILEISGVNVEVRQDPSRLRPSDVPELVGDNTKFCKETGWSPKIPFKKSLEDLLDFWRRRL
jgi:GDP-4-dehydro-6-deoxy-D-mannose reductase